MSERYGNIEYIMPASVAEYYLKIRKGEEKNLPKETYLIKVVNEEFGLMYECTKVTIS